MLPFFAFAVAAVPNIAAPCPGTSTPEVDACLNARLAECDAILNLYYRAALKRAGDGELAPKLIQAERSWIAYRDAECGSVFDFWKGGTIRTSMEIDCRIRLTGLHTYVIWRDWLTYPDSTPSLLPRPDIGDVVSDRRH
jgi:uncharacterized protein YecT (DUF1311 family)